MLGAPPRSYLSIGVASRRMRVPDWRTGHRGRAHGTASITRLKYPRTVDGHVRGYRCLHDSLSGRPCSRHRPRIPEPSRYRMAKPSDGGTSTKRIRTDLVETRKSRDRGGYRFSPDERPHVYRDYGCPDQSIDSCIVCG